jgi:acyl-CoA thioesterase-1
MGRLAILVVGDSIARGDDASRPSMSWAVQVGDWVAETSGLGVSVTNRSVGGATSEDAVRVVKDSLGRPYDLLIVAVGMNDATPGRNGKPGVAPEKYRRNIDRIVRMWSAPLVLVAPIAPGPALKADVIPYRDELAAVSREHRPRVTLADVTSASTEIAGKMGAVTFHRRTGDESLLANGLNHPNDEGHALYADVVSSALGNLLHGWRDGIRDLDVVGRLERERARSGADVDER